MIVCSSETSLMIRLLGYSVNSILVTIPTLEPSNTRGDLTSISSPITNHIDSKRKGSKDVCAPPMTKRPRRSSNTQELPQKGKSCLRKSL